MITKETEDFIKKELHELNEDLEKLGMLDEKGEISNFVARTCKQKTL